MDPQLEEREAKTMKQLNIKQIDTEMGEKYHNIPNWVVIC